MNPHATIRSLSPVEHAVLRDGTSQDLNLIRSGWLRSYARSSWARSMTAPGPWSRDETAPVYWTGHHEIIGRLLERSRVRVASWPEDLWTMLGWCVSEGNVLHYAYVLQPYRRQGLARRLLEDAGLVDAPHVRYSHRSRVCNSLPVPEHWTYDPYGALL